MIVDCHTQVWDPAAHVGPITGLPPARLPRADAARHLRALDPVDRAIVLAFKSRYLQAEISNRFVAEYVRQYAPKMVGFAGIDPTDPDWPAQLSIAHEELQLKGVTISPALQNFHPADTRAMRLYAACLERGLPVLFEQNLRNPAAKMEFARPLLLDEVAREFPQLRIIVSHLGYPWVEETIVLLGKHPNVYADIAGLQQHAWLAYNALLATYEYGVMDKLLFGSDFPYRLPAECIEALYSINQLSHGTNLKTIPREQLRGIVERDTLSLLGIEPPAAPGPKPKSGIFADDD
jgi:predicted TIM-barrel fold metal-dependent hydrolase